MSERYSRVFSLTENLYSEGAPVLIEAGALLKDNHTGKVLAQLKFKNIQNKKIKALTIKISPKNIMSESLGDDVEYQYLDLDEERNASFASKTPIILPDASTREYNVIVTNVIFADNSTWDYADVEWEPLEQPVTLEQALGEPGFVEQYRLVYGSNCQYMYLEQKDLWQCSCGAINHDDEPLCHICNKQSNDLQEVNLDKLINDYGERHEQEVEEAAARKVVRTARVKKITMWTAISVAVLLVVGVSGKILYDVNQKNQAYERAVKLSKTEKFDKAKKALEALDGYKDSEKILKKVIKAEKDYQFDKAMELVGSGAYTEAVEALKALNDYKESDEIAATIEQEVMAVEIAIQAYKNTDIVPMVEVIMNHQYVMPPEKYKNDTQLIQAYIGTWEYASGNSKVLNMRDKDKEDIEKCKTVTTTPQFLDTGGDSILLNMGDFSFSFRINFVEKKLEPLTGFTGGLYDLSLTEEGNLLVTLERHDKKIITCEYKRTELENVS